MKRKMLERMENFQGNPKPEIVERVQVRIVHVDDKGKETVSNVGYGIVTKSPNKNLRIEKDQ